MMNGREVNSLRADIRVWHGQIKQLAPSLAPSFIGSGFDDPGFVDSFSDQVHDWDLMRETLSALLGRRPTLDEQQEWVDLVTSSSRAAISKRQRTLHALDDPAWRRLPDKRPIEEDIIEELKSMKADQAQTVALRTNFKYVVPSKARKEKTPETEILLREKLMIEISEIVFLSNMPMSRRIGQKDFPTSLIVRLAGGRRSGTLRKHVRALRRLVTWCQSVLTRSFPETWEDIARYMEDLATIPCGPTVPRTTMKALQFVEEVGGAKEGDRMSQDPSLVKVCQDITVEIRKKRGGSVRKAPQPPLAEVLALEANVGNGFLPVYLRLYSWTKLNRIWGATRWSDLLFAPPRLARLTAEGLKITVTQTKTTGPGKKVELIYVYVSANAYIHVNDWLETGWRLFNEMGNKERDFWLPLPTKSLEAFSHHKPKFSDGIATTRQMMGELTTWRAVQLKDSQQLEFEPLLRKDGQNELLFEHLAQLFWTEHGDRSVLVNWAMVLGFPKETRQLLGRWTPDSADEYLRTQRMITMRTQAAIAQRIRRDESLDCLGEVDLWADFRDWAKSKEFPDRVIEKQITKLRLAFAGSSSTKPAPDPPPPGDSRHDDEKDWYDAGGANEDSRDPAGVGVLFDPVGDGYGVWVGSDSQPEVQDDLDYLEVPAPPAPVRRDWDTDTEVETAVPKTGIPEEKDGSFVISQTSSGKAKTLHRLGKCWRRPGIDYSYYAILDTAETLEAANEAGYTKVCKDCYPGREVRKGDDSSSSLAPRLNLDVVGTDSSSSDSDSSSSEDGNVGEVIEIM